MSKRYADEKWRKPRVAVGTPFYRLSNYFALGVLAVSGACWYLYECWPGSQKITKDIVDGKYDLSADFKYRLTSLRQSQKDPTYHSLIVKMQEQAYEREETVREEPWSALWIMISSPGSYTLNLASSFRGEPISSKHVSTAASSCAASDTKNSAFVYM